MTRTELAYSEICARLHRLRQREKTVRLGAGAMGWLSLLLTVGFVLVLVESLFRFPPAVRLALVCVFALFAIILFFLLIVCPLFSLLFRKQEPDDDTLALRAGQAFPEVRDRLADGMQVYRSAMTGASSTSASLAQAALASVADAVRSLDFTAIVSKRSLVLRGRILAGVAAVILLSSIIFSGGLSGGLVRMRYPHQRYIVPPPFQLTVLPGDTTAVLGSDVTITVRGEGNVPESMILSFQEEGAPDRDVTLRRPFTHTLAAIRRNTAYHVRAGGVETSRYRITVVERPMVRTLQVELTPPAYAKLGRQVLESNMGDVDALKGTRVDLTVRSSKALDTAVLRFDEGSARPMTVDGCKADVRFAAQRDDRYRVALTDTAGLDNADPVTYTVRVRPDLDPVARILFPAQNVDLDESMSLSLTLEAEDDYGISRAGLEYAIHSGGEADTSASELSFHTLDLEPGEPDRVLLNTEWELTDLGLFPEDVVAYTFVVWDNDRVSGPKSARSRTFTVRFPSMAEIFEEVDAEQSSQTESLTDMAGEGRELQDALEQISQEMMAGRELEWEDKKNLEALTETRQRMQEEVDALKARMDDLVDRMERHDLVSDETLEKYAELQAIYEEMASSELAEALRKLQDAMQQISQEALQKAVEQFKLNQESFLKSIERTISLLKRIQIEQKADELVRRTQDLMTRQETVNEALPQADDETLSDLAQDEQGIKADTEALRREMDNLLAKMQEAPDMPTSALTDAMQHMDQKDLPGQLSQAQAAMQQGRQNQAASAGRGAQQTMTSLFDMLQALQKQLKEDQKEKMVRALRRISGRLLQLSDTQEALADSSQNSEMDRMLTGQQQLAILTGLNQVADSLVTLSHQTFFVTPAMGRAIGETQARMQQALQVIGQGRSAVLFQSQKGAVGGLNRTVMAIQDAMDRMSNSQSGLGMEQFFMQMEQLAQQQAAINQQTLEMMRQGQLSLEQQAAMTRLAAEQQAVRKALRELAQEFGGRSEILGRLDQMARDMEEVIRNFETNQISRETIQRQERILSRLLDAQRSMRQRDLSKKRQARTGREIVRGSPPELSDRMQTLSEQLRRDILRLAKEGYTEPYQALIRQYFEALAREARAQTQERP